MKTLRGEGGKELSDAHRKIEELSEEVSGLGLKAKGCEEALTMAQQLLRRSEANEAKVEALFEDEHKLRCLRDSEVARCREAVEAALGPDAPKPRKDAAGLEDRLSLLTGEYRRVREELEGQGAAHSQELIAAKREVQTLPLRPYPSDRPLRPYPSDRPLRPTPPTLSLPLSRQPRVTSDRPLISAFCSAPSL